jgi:hypothetical protein
MSLQSNRRGRPLSFRNPTTGKRGEGEIVDYVWAKMPEKFAHIAPKNDGWREAAYVAELIKWSGASFVRFTYFVRKEGTKNWRFGGQYSPFMPLRDFRSLFSGLKRKHW